MRQKEELPKDISGEFYAGYDPGGKESFAAFAIAENQNGKLIVKYTHQETGKPYTTVNVESAPILLNGAAQRYHSRRWSRPMKLL
ncbi:MAG: hypothetical protein HYY67_05645 [Thaumarchaeota archaeon]|nr:hypothetical protein [Nitrososphaerota archaeon]